MMHFFRIRRGKLQRAAFDHKHVVIGRGNKNPRGAQDVAAFRLLDHQIGAAVENPSQQALVLGRKMHHDRNGRLEVSRQAAEDDGQSFQTPTDAAIAITLRIGSQRELRLLKGEV